MAANHVPLGDPTKADVQGTLTVHTATVSAGPLLAEIAGLLGTKETTLTLATEQKVPFTVAGGRVRHENFTIMVQQTPVRTSGSVGFDGTVAMTIDVQVPPWAAQQTFPHNPRVKEWLAKQVITVPMGGTMAKPVIDRKAFETGLAKHVQTGIREAAKDLGGEAIKKGQDKLREELEKKLGGKLPFQLPGEPAPK